MCILLGTSAHPDYEVILISNRDEFFQRRTHGTCWHHDGKVLSPYDMSINKGSSAMRCGTWCGVNRTGRVACILNLKTAEQENIRTLAQPKSRGMVPLAYLTSNEVDDDQWNTYEKFALQYPHLKETGSFSLFYGDFQKNRYRIIDSLGHTFSVLTDASPYMVISNDVYVPGSAKWMKINRGWELLQALVQKPCEDILEECFKIASVEHTDASSRLDALTESIYVSPMEINSERTEIGASIPEGKYYGTRSQIVMLVGRHDRKLQFVERILHENDEDADTYSSDHPKAVNEFTIDL